MKDQNGRVIDTYRADPRRVEQDANIERSIVEGAYAKRQLYELIQNAADAMRESRGRCGILLTDTHLYVANTGEPLTIAGVEALMASHMSTKRDEQIGRFGLGFKSVLAVTDTPSIISRTGTLRFDRSWSEQVLAAEVPDALQYPATRLAEPVDPEELRRSDPELARMMKWASTVVALPLRGNHRVLSESIRDFPAEFLLFSTQVHQLELEDRTAGKQRQVTLDVDPDDMLVLRDSGRRSRWVVASTKHSPSAAALADGGYQAARDLVTLSWAAPVDAGVRGVGTFWAYFPTSDATTLSGIVNAPWKLADDRASLLPGTFNDELLTEVLPDLITKALPRVHSSERQATVIDVLPARGREARNHADDVINTPIMEAVAESRSVPTLAGNLARPEQVKMHPEDVETDELELWASVCTDPDKWVSHTITTIDRRSKVSRLGAHARPGSGLRIVEMQQWIEHLVRSPTVEASAAAVRLVASLITRRPELRDVLTSAKVLLLEDGTVHPCRRGTVFLPGGAADPTHHLFIDPILAADPNVERALQTLGIEILDNVGALRAELSAPTPQWRNVWIAARRLPVGEAEDVFREVLGDQILVRMRVQTADGNWRKPGDVYLPGTVIPADTREDRGSLVHPLFHQQDIELLGRLGLVDAPVLLADPPTEPWRSAAEQTLRDIYRRHLDKPRLQDSSIDIQTGRLPWPLDPITRLSLPARAVATERLTRQLSTGRGWRIVLTAGGRDMRSNNDPVWRFLGRHGALPTAVGVQPVGRCLAYDEKYAEIDGVRQPLPVVQPTIGEEVATALGLLRDPGELDREDWRRLLREAETWPMERRALLYTWAAGCEQPAPDRIRVRCGNSEADRSPSEVAIATSEETFASLVAAECPTLLVVDPADADQLISEWGLVDGADMLVESVDHDPVDDSVLLIDRYPPLRNQLGVAQQSVRLQLCSRLELLTSTPSGERARPLSCRLEDNTVLTTATHDRDILSEAAKALGLRLDPDRILRRMEEQHKTKLRAEIAAAEDVSEKLLLAVGSEHLRSSLPAAALASLGDSPEDDDIAQLALAVDGYDILIRHKQVLNNRGLEPPSQWAGTRPAREWARRLGFPIEFAGFAGANRAPELEVQGPPVLGELHDYQTQIATRILGLLDPDSERRRGLVPLPTGAGKTRVAVQALIEYLSGCQDDVDIVWVAESDELCEQAVRTWSEVWRAKGAPGRPLTISRLWANNNPADQAGLQVVVATIRKLQSIVDRPEGWAEEYGWLGSAAMIVVDEAHRSIAPEYTRVLSALGGGNRVADMTTPLLGLTATPYRGFNNEETRRLADRYHGHLLDSGIFPDNDVYGFLQHRGVLARVNQVRLTGSEVTLTDDELQFVAEWRNVPESLGARLGEDNERNTAIVNSILGLKPDASILLFATSVENARVLAALLAYHGVEARAIAGQTPPAARRRYIEEFRDGRIRVLTNYSVFAEGFDAPKVDAVYVTRPTFSPNVYQQMIGRGLRGPLNGGKEEVLVVNVEDNLTNYGEEYAFRHFEHLWDSHAQ